MFARRVDMHLKPNSVAEFTQRLEKDILPLLRKQKGFQDEITRRTAARDGANALRRTQRAPGFCSVPEEECLLGIECAWGHRPAGACVEFFARATGKARHPQLFGEGETRRAHAISNVQELATRGKASRRVDRGGTYVFTYMDCYWGGCWLGSRKSFSGSWLWSAYGHPHGYWWRRSRRIRDELRRPWRLRWNDH